MTSDERDPLTRAQFLIDRVCTLLADAGVDIKTVERRLDALSSDVKIAFMKAEAGGVRKGLIQGRALSKLSVLEKEALGLQNRELF